MRNRSLRQRKAENAATTETRVAFLEGEITRLTALVKSADLDSSFHTAGSGGGEAILPKVKSYLIQPIRWIVRLPSSDLSQALRFTGPTELVCTKGGRGRR
jgi:hypothetical protein